MVFSSSLNRKYNLRGAATSNINAGMEERTHCSNNRVKSYRQSLKGPSLFSDSGLQEGAMPALAGKGEIVNATSDAIVIAIPSPAQRT
jgi:hypothetical protein